MADSAAVTLQKLTATGFTPGGQPSLAPLTASGYAPGGKPSLRTLTATGRGDNADAAGRVTMEVLTGAVIENNPNVATAAVTLQKLSAKALTPTAAAVALEKLTLSGRSDSGQVASGAAKSLLVSASGVAISVGSAVGTAILQTASARGVELNGGSASAAVAMQRIQGSARGVGGQAGIGAPAIKQLTAAAVGYTTGGVSGSIALPRLDMYAQGEQGLAAQLDVYTMNTRTNAVTRYPSYPANSFARYNGTYLGAGPNGLILLEGGDDTDLGSSGISWTIRTGQLDGKFPGLKRLTEVLLGCRYDGPVRVRVWKDDKTFYDYALPNLTPSTLQQVRVKPGKGARSKYYKIEISGVGTRFEVDSLQATMPELTRRVG